MHEGAQETALVQASILVHKVGGRVVCLADRVVSCDGTDGRWSDGRDGLRTGGGAADQMPKVVETTAEDGERGGRCNIHAGIRSSCTRHHSGL